METAPIEMGTVYGQVTRRFIYIFSKSFRTENCRKRIVKLRSVGILGIHLSGLCCYYTIHTSPLDDKELYKLIDGRDTLEKRLEPKHEAN